jgi:hypothetical protein
MGTHAEKVMITTIIIVAAFKGSAALSNAFG